MVKSFSINGGTISMMSSFSASSLHHVHDIAANLYDHTLPMCGVLPPAVRWISKNRLTYVFEQVPHIQRITYTPKAVHNFSGLEEPEVYYLPMPWLQYFIRFHNIEMSRLHSIQLYARTTPISSMDDILYMCPLPNMDEDSACLGKSTITNFTHTYNMGKQIGRYWSIQDALSIAVNCFWEGGFNNDIHVRSDSIPNQKFTDDPIIDGSEWLKHWESLNLEEDVLRWNLQPVYGVDNISDLCKAYESTDAVDIFDLFRDNR